MLVEGENITRWKRGLVEILAYFINVCEENNLRYYCWGGTAIGAVRHHGIIPWDDDVDVMMPRPDYNKLIGVLKSKIDEDYEIVEPYTCDMYYLTYAKLCKKNTTILEVEHLPFIQGLYIDIFPIDGCSDDYNQYLKEFDAYHKLRVELMLVSSKYSFKYILRQILRLHIKRAFQIMYFYAHREECRKRILEGLKLFEDNHVYGSTQHVAVFSGYCRNKEQVPEIWLGEGTTFEFENLEVVLPKCFDEHLSHFFGDYMQFPPKEQQVTHHSLAYFNLERRVSMDEILTYIKK